jgi:hypothetical protein
MAPQLTARLPITLLVGRLVAAFGPANLGAQEARGVPDDRNPRPIAEVLARGEQVIAGCADQRLGEFGILDVRRG